MQAKSEDVGLTPLVTYDWLIYGDCGLGVGTAGCDRLTVE